MITWDFSGRRAVVTGASSGIGRATARLLAGAGAEVLAVARRRDRLEALAAETSPRGRLEALAGDLTDDSFCRQVQERVAAGEQGLDILVNAAGIIGSDNWETTSLQEWDRMLDINLRSVFSMTRLLLPHLIPRRGAVVNVSSVTGTRAFPNLLAYCVSKAGLDQLTRCLALEVAPQGVRVNAVNPGVVVTELHRAGGMNQEAYAAFLEHSRTTHPLGRVGNAEEVADLIAFLACERAGWITGETISIDGGRHQTCAR